MTDNTPILEAQIKRLDDFLSETGIVSWKHGATWQAEQTIKELRAEVEGLRRIIARSDAKADMWQIRAEAAEARLRKVEAALNASVERMRTTQAVVNLAYLQDDLSAALAAEPAEVAPPAEQRAEGGA